MVIVLHGGPAAAGSAAPIAQGLAGSFRVLEPWQRGRGSEPLTVARHVADVHDVVLSHGDGGRPALVGESWGAMLALAYAAEHAEAAGPIALIGCGTFDPAARARLRQVLAERTDENMKRQLDRLPENVPSAEERLRQRYKLTERLYVYEPIEGEEEGFKGPLDVRAHEETWADMLRLQEEGVYPAAFAAIESPVLMLHGDCDPHPGRMIRDSLAPYLKQLEYHELNRCGHSPWKERFARDEFFDLLRGWLLKHV